ncbi:hypothetical protein L2E82_40328 [Cichorium intybus]|uniref:Uncharacterized protein n=1 Tax=Cichorium intybus TaxID=13427 RepID=A0ACB9AQ43_CICIN|nr:hypothetical protein L2E82_40328 [Cichorium intybus]
MDPATITEQSLLQKHDRIALTALVGRGFSLSSSENHRHGRRLISRPLHSPRTTSFRSLYSFSSSRYGTFLDGIFHEQPPHFLDACFLCKMPLGCNRDIFMYRGDIPFCTEECRSEQIEFDELKEKKSSLSASIKAMRKKEDREKTSNPSPKYPFHYGAVVAA